MKKRIVVTYIILALVSQGLIACAMMALKLSGNIKNPKLEDSQSIIRYSKKMYDPYDYLWLPDTKIHFDEMLTRYPGIPEVLIYDKNFTVLKNAHGEHCQKMLIAFFSDSLKYQYNKVMDSSYFFLKNKSRVIASTSVSTNYDYTIIYSWVKWTPKLTKDIFERLAAIKKSNKYKVCFISLNKDWQKGMYDQAPHFNNKVKNDGSALAPRD
ncbi:MAG: hypothetical protein V4635_08590 [Bacteroidota bacterium]